MDPSSARAHLQAWRESLPDDPYEADGALLSLNQQYLSGERLVALDKSASEFGRTVAAVIAPAAKRYEHRSHLPELARWSDLGFRTEEVDFDPEYHRSGGAVWSSGLVAMSGVPGSAFEQATLLYLLSAEGEAGHACPASCTIGLARALRRGASAEIRELFLPALLDSDYATADRGSQFLTEVQGGSDVGANVCEAVASGDGSYLLTGEKWFCSVADAQQFLVTARPVEASEGTRGLGCFVMPRYLDGEPNGFSIRRLKDKLGTRGMASGEIDLTSARAWPVGPIEQGFRTVVGVVLNTSRWLTAVGSTGIMRRAYVEAATYARHRQAFGQPIAQFPRVQMTLASMKTTWLGALHACWLLTDLEDRIDAGSASADDVAFHRFLVNALKFTASSAASEVVRSGIEVLGGNGTIEDFSVLPRLYRDAMVYESWEGTHNVLCAQVLGDMRRLGLAEVVEARVRSMLAEAPDNAALSSALDGAMASVGLCIDEPEHGAAHFRAALDDLMAVLQAALLARAGSPAADLFVRTQLDPCYRPAADPGYMGAVETVLAGDVNPDGDQGER